MAKLVELEGKAQKEILVVPIIDTSGSMYGANISAVNEAMNEVPAQLAEIEQNQEVDILVAPIAFSNGAKWMGLLNDKPLKAEEFVWNDVEATGGTDMGAAFSLLNEKLTTIDKGGWMDGRKGLRPILLLISDGEPNDEWQTPLNELRRRGWFKVACKFAIAVGAGADKSVLEEFTKTRENIYDTETLRCGLATLIKAIVMASSIAVSDGAENQADPTSAQGDLEDQVQAGITEAVETTVGDIEKNPTDMFDDSEDF